MLMLRVRAGLGRRGLGKGGRGGGEEGANSARFGCGLRLRKKEEGRREGKDWRERERAELGIGPG